MWFYDLNGFVSTGDGVDIGVILNNIFPSLYQTHKEMYVSKPVIDVNGLWQVQFP